MSHPLILGSGSPHRRKMLENAGLTVDIIRPEIDERAVEEAVAGSGLSAEDLAALLAEAKAVDVSERAPAGTWVIGCDQTMELEGRLFHKPADMEGARRHLLALSGKTHQLHSAIVLARNGEVEWRYVDTARITIRKLDPGFIGRHLAQVGEAALTSVGAYQVEGPGIQLFERIEGDFFTIVGLPLIPLLAKLRELGVIDG